MTTTTIYDLLRTNNNGKNNLLIDCTFSTMTDEHKVEFCKTILDDDLFEYGNMVCEQPDIFPGHIIWKSLSDFIQETYEFSDIQYELMSNYLECIEMTPFVIKQIKELIIKKQYDTQLVEFLGIWIGYDKELDGIVDNILARLFAR